MIAVPKDVSVAACEAGGPISDLLCGRRDADVERVARAARVLIDGGPGCVERWCAAAITDASADPAVTAAPDGARAALYMWAASTLNRPVAAAHDPGFDYSAVLATLSAKLNRLHADAFLELLTLADSEMERALTRVGLKITKAAETMGTGDARKASGVAAAWRPVASVDADTVALWRGHAPEKVPAMVAAATPAVWAALAPSALEDIRRQFETDLAKRATRVIDARQRELLDTVAAELGVPVETLADDWGLVLEDQRDAAVTLLVGAMVAVAATRITGRTGELRDEGDAVSGRATTGAVEDALAVAGGAAVAESAVAGFGPVASRTDDGRPVSAAGRAGLWGLTHGSIGVDVVDQAVTYEGDRVGVTAKAAVGLAALGAAVRAGVPTRRVRRWVHRHANPFAPHENLAGKEWSTNREYRAAASWSPAAFPFVAFLRPNDHNGCACFIEILVDVDNDEVDNVLNELDTAS